MSFGVVAASYVAVMETMYQYDFEDGTDEVTYVIDTPANGVGAVADTAQAAHGSVSLRADNNAGYQYIQKNFPSAVTDVATRYYIYQDVAVTGNAEHFRFQSDTTSYTNPNCTVRVQMQGTNKFRIYDNTGTVIWTAANALTPATWYRFEIRVQCGTTANATISGAYYVGDSTTPIETFNITNATTTATVASTRIGRPPAGTVDPTTGHLWFDDWAIDTAPTGLIGPYNG